MYVLTPNSIYIPIPSFPLVTIRLWIYFCFVYKFICIIFFLDFTSK